MFFDGPLHEDRGPLIRANPILAHNNFLVGKDKKLERFRAHGMWYADFIGAFDDALLRRAPSQSCSTLEVLGVAPEVRSIDDVLFVHGRTALHLHSSCSLKDRVVAVASLGERPWVSTLIQRVAAYSIKVDADLLVAGDASQCYTHEEGDNGCAKAFKLIVRTQRLLQRVDGVCELRVNAGPPERPAQVSKSVGAGRHRGRAQRCPGRLRSCTDGSVRRHRRGSSSAFTKRSQTVARD